MPDGRTDRRNGNSREQTKAQHHRRRDGLRRGRERVAAREQSDGALVAGLARVLVDVLMRAAVRREIGKTQHDRHKVHRHERLQDLTGYRSPVDRTTVP